MSKKQTGRTEGYLLPLFADNIRNALELSQEALQNAYVKLLEESIESSVEELLSELQLCVSTDEKETCSSVPSMRLDFRLDKKSMIVFYYALRTEIEMIRGTRKRIDRKTYDTIAERIKKKQAYFTENFVHGSHGGIEIRSIRNLLKYNFAHSNSNTNALHFVLTKLFPSILSRHSDPNTARIEYRFFNGTLESRDSIVSQLLSIEIKGEIFEIDNEALKNNIVEKLIQGKAAYKRTKARSKGESEKEIERIKESEYSKLFEEIWQIEDIWQQISVSHATTHDDRHEYYSSVGATFTKSIISGLLGVDSSVAMQKWDEISEVVYGLVLIAEEQSEALWRRRDTKTEMLSFESIFITEFIILFFASKEIRAVMNALSPASIKGSEDIENE